LKTNKKSREDFSRLFVSGLTAPDCFLSAAVQRLAANGSHPMYMATAALRTGYFFLLRRAGRYRQLKNVLAQLAFVLPNQLTLMQIKALGLP